MQSCLSQIIYLLDLVLHKPLCYGPQLLGLLQGPFAAPTTICAVSDQLFRRLGLASDEDIGKRGVVFVLFFDGEPDVQACWKLPNIFHCVPLRFEATHLCHDDARAIKAVDSVVKLMAGMFIRVRSRNHYSKQMDRQQKEKSRDDLTKVFIRALHAGS